MQEDVGNHNLVLLVLRVALAAQAKALILHHLLLEFSKHLEVNTHVSVLDILNHHLSDRLALLWLNLLH